MTPIMHLAARSILNRRVTALLTIFAIAVSTTLLLGVERIRTEARAGFAHTISGTDLIVGSRSGAIQLLLYSVFRIGDPTNNIQWDSYEEIAAAPEVAWTIPISLGDSHRGFRVMGTDHNYFEHYRYAKTRMLDLDQGRPFSDVFETVLGADVAATLGYQVNQEIVLAHGVGVTSFAQHDNRPFRVVGILKKTATPVDRTVHVTLEGIEAMHVGWESGARMPGRPISAADVTSMDLRPDELTAFLVGLSSRIATFKVQRKVNEFAREPLLAIIPGVALQQVWDLVSIVEVALLAVSAFVALTGLMVMLSAILTSLNERRREMAILRAVGARPWHVFALLVSEAGLLAVGGVVLGIGLVYLLSFLLRPVVEAQFGIYFGIAPPGLYEATIALVVAGAALLLASLPAWRAYRNSLADGMTIRI